MKLYRMSSAALVCVFLLGACQQGDQVEEGEDEEETPAIPVETTTPIRGDIDATYTGTAPIEAFSEATVIAKVEGEVRQILIEEGDTVVKNQVLARLDGDRLRLELNESQARLRKLQRDFERNQELTETGLISEGDFEKIKFDLEALQAAYNLANLELDYTQIRAPIDGVVSERFIKIGNTIKAGDPIFHVTSLSPLVAYLHVPEREYRQIAAGQPAGIRIDALGGDPILAYVTRVSPIVDPATGTFKITIEIGNEQKRIKPGMFGRMAITYDRHENALQIPRSAIIESATATSVLVEEEGIAIRKAVQTGYSINGMIEITNGLDDGENVITVGQVGLKSDSRVNVINRPVDDDPVPDDSSGAAVMTEGSTASIEDAD
ncbi:MAG: efflux RND transporter periplasmic adaptor subunit [Proteobacteria bacterium]|nr:efflux RND transporter periplasmic adaptor subunit [Pseudomonadota bacterium]